jgi:protein-S-isoprenylcysteine O-methyltransferase Ste14
MGIREIIGKSPFLLSVGWLSISLIFLAFTTLINWAIKLPIWTSPLLIILGLLLIVTGFICRYSAFKHLVSLNKSIKSEYTPEHFTTEGIYKSSRNPAYVGIMLMLIGSFLLAINLLMIIVLIGILIWLNNSINYEEKMLTQKFGNAYIEYKNKTPKWL